MQGQWNHDRAYYRCKFPATTPVSEHDHPKSIYVKEDAIVPSSTTGSGASSTSAPRRAPAKRSPGAPSPSPKPTNAASRPPRDAHQGMRRQARPVPRRSSSTTATLTIVATWIAEVERERRSLERDSVASRPAASSPRTRSRALVDSAARTSSESSPTRIPTDKAELYDELGVTSPTTPTDESTSSAGRGGVRVRVGGGT